MAEEEAATDVQTEVDEEEKSVFEEVREALQEAGKEIQEAIEEAMEEEAEDEVVVEEEIVEEPEPEPEPETTEVTAETQDEETPALQKAISGITSNIRICFTSSKSTFMDLKERVMTDKDAQQKLKKAAAFSLGAWGAVTGGNWIYQRTQNDEDVAPIKGKGRR